MAPGARLRLVAAESIEVVASDGTRLRVAVQGPGLAPPVVLLHGLSCIGEMWDGVTAVLAPTHRVVVPDLRGHGASVPVVDGDDPFGLAQQAADIRSVLEDLDLTEVVLVGHSGGGYAALDLAARHPDVVHARVRRIVTIGTAGSLTNARERAVLRFSSSRLFYALLASPRLGRQLVRRGAFGRRPRPEWIEATRAMARSCPRETKAAWVGAISGTSVQNDLAATATLVTPVTVATGSLDRAVTPKRAAELAAARGRFGTLAILDGAGHMAPLEQPEAIAELVRNVRP